MPSKQVLDVEEWYDDDDGPTRCAVCGDDIEPGDEFVWEPDVAIGPNVIVSSHPGCAVRNGYAIRRLGD